jgi:diketogulonate reductase-like aldo/keto reductase
MSSKETLECVAHALKFGYRHIDTATLYGNEREVGEAVRKSRISRDKVFVTTKLWNNDQGRDRAPRAFEESLKELDLGYIDLYLIHWPIQKLRHKLDYEHYIEKQIKPIASQILILLGQSFEDVEKNTKQSKLF